MKSRFFKKSLPQSASCDSQLSATQQPQLSTTCATSNFIDKPSSNHNSARMNRPTSLMMSGYPTAGEVAGTPTSSTTTNGSKQYFMLSPVTAATSATSPSCSSTQGIIAGSGGIGGCGTINELLEQYRGWNAMAPVPCTNAMLRHGASIPASAACSGNQVADLVFMLAQQISHKDAHIERMRAAMRKGDMRVERACRELEREVERKTQVNELISCVFVDPLTAACTNHVEAFWKNAKKKNKEMCETNEEMLPSYLDEFQWSQIYGKKTITAFDNLMDKISNFYPVNN